MDSIRDQLLAVVLGLFFLHVFYRAVEMHWPQNYYAFDSPTDPIISRTATRYLGFRLLPIYVVSLFVGVTLDRFDAGPPWPAVLAIAVLHAALTSAHGFVDVLFRRVPASARIGRLVFHGTTTLLIIAAGLAALLGRAQLSGLIPQPPTLTAALWTAVLASVLGAYVVRLTQVPPGGAEGMVVRSTKELGIEVIEFAKSESDRVGTDWDLFFSLLVVENVQRPKWVRRLERLKAKVLGTGSYGVMQVASKQPLSDKESITRVADSLAGVRLPRHTGYEGFSYPDDEALRTFALAHNPDANFANFVQQVCQAVNFNQSLLP